MPKMIEGKIAENGKYSFSLGRESSSLTTRPGFSPNKWEQELLKQTPSNAV
jgi:hypothetical protein